MNTDSTLYPSKIQELLAPLVDLRFDYSQQSDTETQKRIQDLCIEDVFEEPVVNQHALRCCHSGLWLLHGCLHESHEISQTIHISEGSYWHAIMHRAEGDYWNSKYWYRKIGSHTVLNRLEELGMSGEALVDLCEQASSDPARSDQANELARLEWSLLFDECWKSIATNF
jgi:hypothetical protein